MKFMLIRPGVLLKPACGLLLFFTMTGCNKNCPECSPCPEQPCYAQTIVDQQDTIRALRDANEELQKQLADCENNKKATQKLSKKNKGKKDDKSKQQQQQLEQYEQKQESDPQDSVKIVHVHDTLYLKPDTLYLKEDVSNTSKNDIRMRCYSLRNRNFR